MNEKYIDKTFFHHSSHYSSGVEDEEVQGAGEEAVFPADGDGK